MKRTLSLLLTAALLLTVLLLPVSGAVSMSFIAVNDTIPLTLSGDQRPIYSGGTLYVPYTAFSAASLGFYPTYSVTDKTLTLRNRDQQLVFDLAGGVVTDETQYIQSVSTISKGGTIFLPAVFCASHFGVSVSDLTSLGGYQIIRFTTGSEVYDNSLFVEKAEILIAYRISQATMPTPPSTPSTPVTPTTPNTPGTQPNPPDQEPEQKPARVYLAVTGAEGLADMLAALDQYRQKATFFLTAEEIDANDALVRRLMAEGHYIGLTVTGAEDPAAELALADAALDRATASRALLALLPEGAADEALTVRYRVFSQPATRLTATEASRAFDQTRLLICNTDTLSTSLQVLTAADCEFLPLRETSQLD